MDNIAQIGIGGLFAITVIKTILPYVRPAKNGHVGKEVIEGLQPYQDRQIRILEKMDEREIRMDMKLDQIQHNMPKRRDD